MSYFGTAGLYAITYLLHLVWPIVALILLSAMMKFRFALPLTVALVVSLLIIGGPFYTFAGLVVAIVGIFYFLSM
jgi:hypothetical protein